eukprot:364162-Chlamydomonas_euryale.AAC.6
MRHSTCTTPVAHKPRAARTCAMSFTPTSTCAHAGAVPTCPSPHTPRLPHLRNVFGAQLPRGSRCGKLVRPGAEKWRRQRPAAAAERAHASQPGEQLRQGISVEAWNSCTLSLPQLTLRNAWQAQRKPLMQQAPTSCKQRLPFF